MKVRLYQCFAPPRNHQVVSPHQGWDHGFLRRFGLLRWRRWRWEVLTSARHSQLLLRVQVEASCALLPLPVPSTHLQGAFKWDEELWLKTEVGEWFSHPAQKYPEPVVARGTEPWRQSIANFGRVEAHPFFFMTVEKVNIKCIILAFKQLHFNSNCNE